MAVHRFLCLILIAAALTGCGVAAERPAGTGEAAADSPMDQDRGEY